MRIIFVRHGQDDDTRRGGWSSFGLLREGHAQAKQVAEYHLNQKDYSISAIYASDLTRTMETAGYISKTMVLPVQKDARLREIHNGDLAGMPNDQALAQYPGLFFNTLGIDEKYPGGESPMDFYLRIQTWFHDFLREHRGLGKDVVVVTHGGVIKILYHLVNKLEWTNKSNTFPVAKCSIHVLNTDTMRFEVENQIVWS